MKDVVSRKKILDVPMFENVIRFIFDNIGNPKVFFCERLKRSITNTTLCISGTKEFRTKILLDMGELL